MKEPLTGHDSAWERFHGPNLGYVMEMYEKYVTDPDSIDPEIRKYFEEWGSPEQERIPEPPAGLKKRTASFDEFDTVVSALELVDNIRVYGHLAAEIYPLKNRERLHELIDPQHYGLTENDLKNIPAKKICPDAPPGVDNGLEAIRHLKKVYTSAIAFEFYHVNNPAEKNWLREKVESGSLMSTLRKEKRIAILKRLIEVEEFERFLHKTFVGQKRFSIEGLDTMVPMLDEIIADAVKEGAETINIGMAHRGRLNVLAHILEKPYEMIFAEFQHAPNKELVPSEGSIGINFGWTGDVKYHLGLNRQIRAENTKKVKLTLANNPSHLEFVDSIVEGYTRAAQELRTERGNPKQDPASALAIIIHGDAAFPGQGVVAETLNLSGLKGYHTGGTINIISNNMIGFTTEPAESRSTRYASDLAKGFEIPILHVNGDDPEACVAAARLAAEYRAKFKKDVLIDLVGYRRFGHNEMDEPMTTNPLLYNLVNEHPTVMTLYGKQLQGEGVLAEEELADLSDQVKNKLQKAKEKVPDREKQIIIDPDPPEEVEKELPAIDTTVPEEKLEQMNEELLQWPDDFQVFPKLKRILERRREALGETGKIDWGLAETLAFASIISDGTPVRITGQDTERGTFAQRNLVLHDYTSGKVFNPLHHLSTAKASFAIHNSPLSEASVVGFEYGYNVFAPETLVLWEAQYGDFANAAQVMFDQFVSAGRAKWGQKSGLVMLLPHGYEGQGPEHSSGRLERFLTLSAENNWTVANLTSSAQYFHILRRQAAILNQEEVRPLVIMTPKSLLRNPLVAASRKDLSEGEFQSLIEQPGLGTSPEKVERVVLCSGKIAIDFAEKLQVEQPEWLHIFRVEEIYPFPLKKLSQRLKDFPNVKEIIWAQEEPKNMGAWSFVEPRINAVSPNGLRVKYVGRRRRSSPSEGDPNVHKQEQARIINEIMTRKAEGGNTGGGN